MFIIGEVDDEVRNLVNVTKESIDLVVKSLKPYQTVGDIGYMISKYVHKFGYTIVREIGGHGVGNDFHEEPFIAHIVHVLLYLLLQKYELFFNKENDNRKYNCESLRL